MILSNQIRNFSFEVAQTHLLGPLDKSPAGFVIKYVGVDEVWYASLMAL